MRVDNKHTSVRTHIQLRLVDMALDQKLTNVHLISIGCGHLFQELVISAWMNRNKISVSWTLLDPFLNEKKA